jgi:hypothetical protein
MPDGTDLSGLSWKVIALVASTAATLGSTVGGWIVRRGVAKLDDHEMRIQKLEKTLATKADVDALSTRLGEIAVSINTEISEARVAADDKHNRILELLAFHRRGGS